MHRPLQVAEITLGILLLLVLMWLPLPFGSVTEVAQLPLVLLPLVLFAAASATQMLGGVRTRLSLPYILWTIAGVLILLTAAVQLVSLPPALAKRASPLSYEIWSGATSVHDQLSDSRVGATLRVAPSSLEEFPRDQTLSVSPALTRAQLLVFAAYFGLFQTAFLLLRRSRQRLWLATALAAGALFQFAYGLQQLYRGKVTVWGWENTTAYQRVTGTYVSPNHYAHLLALTFPLALYLAASAITARSGRGARARDLVRRFFERGLVRTALGLVVAMCCLAGILIAQSRGALFSLLAGSIGVAAVFAASRAVRGRTRMRYLVATAAAALVLGLALVFLVRHFGFQQTIARFEPLPEERATLGGRAVGMRAAFDLWRRFPILGSGVGTFGEVVLITQPSQISRVFTHAHNDYLEVIATAGIAGLAVLLLVIGGYVMVWRDVLRSRVESSRERVIFLLAALASLTVFALHSVIDFNLFIPANGGTAAAIAGAAAAAAARQVENDDRI